MANFLLFLYDSQPMDIKTFRIFYEQEIEVQTNTHKITKKKIQNEEVNKVHSSRKKEILKAGDLNYIDSFNALNSFQKPEQDMDLFPVVVLKKLKMFFGKNISQFMLFLKIKWYVEKLKVYLIFFKHIFNIFRFNIGKSLK